MEKRIINWKAEMMKPVVPGSYLMVGWRPPVVKNGEIVGGIACQLFIVTRVTEDGWVYCIESTD